MAVVTLALPVRVVAPVTLIVFTPEAWMAAPSDRAPLTVRMLFKVIPLALLTVRLLRLVTLLGRLTLLELPPNTRFEDEVVDRLVAVPAIVGPFKVRVLEPTANVPLVRVSVPATVRSPPKFMPLALFIIRLLSPFVTEGSDVAAPAPPNVILEVDPPVRVPLVVEMAPFTVRVLAPIDRAPLVRVRVVLTVTSAFKFTPLALSIVRLAILEGNSTPVVWLALPLYCMVAEAPYVGTVPVVVAVPSTERIPLTVVLA